VPARMNAQEVAFYRQHRYSLLTDLIGTEQESGARLLYRDTHAVAFVPACARYPYEVWVAPVQPTAYFGDLSDAQRAGLARIPAIVRQTGDDVLLRDALLENIHRVQLNPLEEAAAYEQLLGEFGVTHAELADRLGRSRPVVTNTIRLLKLPVGVQRRVAAGVLSAGHARALLSLDDPGRQEDLAARVVAEGLSVRATEAGEFDYAVV